MQLQPNKIESVLLYLKEFDFYDNFLLSIAVDKKKLNFPRKPNRGVLDELKNSTSMCLCVQTSAIRSRTIL